MERTIIVPRALGRTWGTRPMFEVQIWYLLPVICGGKFAQLFHAPKRRRNNTNSPV
jgi:hypothetical protein